MKSLKLTIGLLLLVGAVEDQFGQPLPVGAIATSVERTVEERLRHLLSLENQFVSISERP